MAGFKDVFQRIEVKYLLSDRQYTELLKRLENMAAIDSYGRTSILNIYFDTPDFKLIERSLEKPVYKEKLRLRTYGVADDDKMLLSRSRKSIRALCIREGSTCHIRRPWITLPGIKSLRKDHRFQTRLTTSSIFTKV